MTDKQQLELGVNKQRLYSESTDETKEETISSRQQQKTTSLMNSKLNEITDIDLSDPMLSIKGKDRFESNLKNKIIMAIISTLFMLFGNLEFFNFYNENNHKSLRIISIVFWSIVLIICIGLLSYGKIGNTSKESMTQFLNMKLLGIKNPDTMYETQESIYMGIVFILLLIYVCITMIIIEIFYHDINYDYGDKCTPENTRYAADCLATFSTFAPTYPLCFCAELLFWMKHVICSTSIEEIKTNIISKYEDKDTLIKKLDEKIQDRLKNEWMKRTRFTGRKYEIKITFLFFLVFFAGIRGVTNDLTSIDFKNNIGLLIGVFLFFIFDSIFVTFMMLSAHTIVLHYEFPWIIMNELLLPIHANVVEDILGWWELRKYYIYCVINVYITSLKYAIAAGLIVSITLSVFALYNFNSVGIGLLAVYIVFVVYTFGITFFLVANAVSYYNAQLLHVNTMNKEKLRLTYRSKSDMFYNIIDYVNFDIENNSVPISVIGVRMDTNFMLFLRATAITVGLAFIFEGFS